MGNDEIAKAEVTEAQVEKGPVKLQSLLEALFPAQQEVIVGLAVLADEQLTELGLYVSQLCVKVEARCGGEFEGEFECAEGRI